MILLSTDGRYSTSQHCADMLQVWYAVAPGKDRRRFEELAKGLFPKDAAKCANFLRHKTILITPQMLKKHGIPYVKASTHMDMCLSVFNVLC